MAGMLNDIDKARNDLWHLNFIVRTGFSILFSFCLFMALWLGIIPRRGGGIFERDKAPASYWVWVTFFFVLMVFSIYNLARGVLTKEFINSNASPPQPTSRSRMKFRKLRITWSVAWGLACALLVLLFARSYWRSDAVIMPCNSARVYIASSNIATLELAYTDNQDARAAFQGWVTSPAYWDANERGEVGMFNRIRGGRPIFRVPHWALFLPAFGFAVAPWFRRFSLRTFLIIVGLVSAALALFSLYAPMELR
jgi:hypothetical protein